MLIVSFHGGAGGQCNLIAYQDDGTPLPGAVLANLDAMVADAELRGLSFAPNGELWVLNASRARSEILSFSGPGPPHVPTGRLATYPDVEALWHPFDFTFSIEDGTLYCYVANQDTNVVARLIPAADGRQLIPAPVAPALPPDHKFLQGTFVASANGNLPGVPHTHPIAASDGGLCVEIEKGKICHSVRGVLWANPSLYVADEPGDAVKVYDATGRFQGQSTTIRTPVHLLATSGHLYAAAREGVFWTPLDPRAPARLAFPATASIEMAHASGIALGSDQSLYVANRKQNKICVYADFSPDAPPVLSRTFDVEPEPEFILYVEN
jgi:hypothetical protein